MAYVGVGLISCKALNALKVNLQSKQSISLLQSGKTSSLFRMDPSLYKNNKI